ncbi:TetR/AcrR family transcriptional regulator [Rhodococcus tukisamuensis]|uniref:DNA-binding transcriptional regulator, AcrR family n=1 Tax=Rhodococcus tukisamuensis TaxID=168276 RepID=A0A1G7DWG0_9NOCA|nr:TetR/AcrR family transcriptional regulator [Rhodococcus tukisamuensis]SDE55799.1 DNA-binding transcriptional regulator, AcrR family [Rhodococcus tukisamuensis]
MPRISAPTVAQHRAAQRRALLDAAREVLTEGATDIPGFAEVAARAGLARSSMYQYFKSRRDLLDALVEDSFPRWSDRVEREMDAAGAPDRRVLAYVRANLDLVAEGEHAIASSIAAIAPTEKMTETSALLHRKLVTPLVTALTELGATDPAATAELINAVVHAATRQVEAGGDPVAVQARAAELIEPYLTFAATSRATGNINP